ncbi:FMN-dependent NADH-azoreductase [Amycolatopsis samaneae]|uniref:FMN dependent NADH:quinone oxidoreductase n=1 Tax=Amycolatopsis samaneae TaxID=664691 RepID=A0ABW5GLF1_9PSEU
MSESLTRQPGPSLLHLDSSADRGSVSRGLTGSFADIWRSAHGAAGYRHRDLSADPVPLVGPAYVALGTRVERHGVVPASRVEALIGDAAEEREWALTRSLIAEVLAADVLLFGVPMYNLAIPAALKAWIDRVSFPGLFTDPDTGESLLRDTRVVVVMARGGGYGPGAPLEGLDFQTPYLRAYFRRLGVAEEHLHFVAAELTRAGDIPTLAGFQGLAAESLAAAREAVTALATRLTEPSLATS